jgi:hypothetical protein
MLPAMRVLKPRVFVMAALASLSLSLTACTHDVGNEGSLVGGSCDGDGDCQEECLKGGDFPRGTCSVSCRDDADCPAETDCVDKSGGVCLLSCTSRSDCREGYTCKGEKNKGEGGESLVCID